MCGKEFVKEHAGQKFCHWKCQKQYQKKPKFDKQLIHRIAKKYNFEIKNEDKIIRAKMLLFRNDDMKRCPLSSTNPNKYYRLCCIAKQFTQRTLAVAICFTQKDFTRL